MSIYAIIPLLVLYHEFLKRKLKLKSILIIGLNAFTKIGKGTIRKYENHF